MGIQIWFMEKPFESEEIFDCITEPKTFQEFKELYPSFPSDLDSENVLIEFPDSDKLNTLQIESVELKNLFNKYQGRTIFVSMNNEKYGIPSYVHKIP